MGFFIACNEENIATFLFWDSVSNSNDNFEFILLDSTRWIWIKMMEYSFFNNRKPYLYQGRPQLKKSQKFRASCRNFLDPLLPSSKKGPTDENVGISYLKVIIKFGFFSVSNPSSPISSESQTSPILSNEVVPKWT